MFWVMLVNAMAYMPTIALSKRFVLLSLSLAKAGRIQWHHFRPIMRVFGAIGLLLRCGRWSSMGLELSSAQLYIASGASCWPCMR